MTPTERRYAQIEKEALTFTWACKRLWDYLVGMLLHIQTDHKPLVPLFSSKNLEQLPLWVQRFQMRIMHFLYNISHVPGKELTIANALSHGPDQTPTEREELLQRVAMAYVEPTERRIEEI